MTIARLWHGRVAAAKAAAYRAFLVGRALPDYRGVDGNLGVRLLERVDGDVVHFRTLSLWRDLDAIRAFAGVEPLRAKYYAEDVDFLLEFEPEVEHWDVVGDA
jgi:heme-degrading monooxygenase HmoA